MEMRQALVCQAAAVTQVKHLQRSQSGNVLQAVACQASAGCQKEILQCVQATEVLETFTNQMVGIPQV
jgi:hypothetical protein